jgi:hypothetical protein
MFRHQSRGMCLHISAIMPAFLSLQSCVQWRGCNAAALTASAAKVKLMAVKNFMLPAQRLQIVDTARSRSIIVSTYVLIYNMVDVTRGLDRKLPCCVAIYWGVYAVGVWSSQFGSLILRNNLYAWALITRGAATRQ